MREVVIILNFKNILVCILMNSRFCFSKFITGNNNEAQAFLSKGGQVIVRMRGLPYDCTAKQVVSDKKF